MSEVTINGKAYVLIKDPTHRSVRDMRTMQKAQATELLLKYKDEIQYAPGVSVEQALFTVLSNHPTDLAEFQVRQDEFNDLATIALATGQSWAYEDFDDLGEREFRTLVETCKKALGGDAADFFGSYEKNTSSRRKSGTKSP